MSKADVSMLASSAIFQMLDSLPEDLRESAQRGMLAALMCVLCEDRGANDSHVDQSRVNDTCDRAWSAMCALADKFVEDGDRARENMLRRN